MRSKSPAPDACLQLVLLSAASQRDDHCLVRPSGPKRGPAQRAVAKLLEAGLLKEIRAKAGAPIWRTTTRSGQTYALKLTAAGAKAKPKRQPSSPAAAGRRSKRCSRWNSSSRQPQWGCCGFAGETRPLASPYLFIDAASQRTHLGNCERRMLPSAPRAQPCPAPFTPGCGAFRRRVCRSAS